MLLSKTGITASGTLWWHYQNSHETRMRLKSKCEGCCIFLAAESYFYSLWVPCISLNKTKQNINIDNTTTSGVCSLKGTNTTRHICNDSPISKHWWAVNFPLLFWFLSHGDTIALPVSNSGPQKLFQRKKDLASVIPGTKPKGERISTSGCCVGKGIEPLAGEKRVAREMWSSIFISTSFFTHCEHPRRETQLCTHLHTRCNGVCEESSDPLTTSLHPSNNLIHILIRCGGGKKGKGNHTAVV